MLLGEVTLVTVLFRPVGERVPVSRVDECMVFDSESASFSSLLKLELFQSQGYQIFRRPAHKNRDTLQTIMDYSITCPYLRRVGPREWQVVAMCHSSEWMNDGALLHSKPELPVPVYIYLRVMDLTKDWIGRLGSKRTGHENRGSRKE